MRTNTYESSTAGRCVTAMNILDGLGISGDRSKWDRLQPVWDSEGMGFLEFCGWITDVAAYSEELLTLRQPQDFPGVYDYNVSCSFGEWLGLYMATEQALPPLDVWRTELAQRVSSFFEQGTNHA